MTRSSSWADACAIPMPKALDSFYAVVLVGLTLGTTTWGAPASANRRRARAAVVHNGGNTFEQRMQVVSPMTRQSRSFSTADKSIHPRETIARRPSARWCRRRTLTGAMSAGGRMLPSGKKRSCIAVVEKRRHVARQWALISQDPRASHMKRIGRSGDGLSVASAASHGRSATMWLRTSSTGGKACRCAMNVQRASKRVVEAFAFRAQSSRLSAVADAGVCPRQESSGGGWCGDGRTAGQYAANMYGIPICSAIEGAAI